jgi:hypothetical protein
VLGYLLAVARRLSLDIFAWGCEYEVLMAVSPAHITLGGFYARSSEVREVIGIAPSGDVTFLSRSRTDLGGQLLTLDIRSRELFATEVEEQVSPYYRPPQPN